MKKVLLLVLCITLSVTFVACTVGTEETTTTKKIETTTKIETKPTTTVEPTITVAPTTTTEKGVFTGNEFKIKYLSNSLIKDYQGKDVLKVVFECTNTGTETKAPIYNISIKAFQNGVEIDQAYFVEDEDESLTDTMSEVRPGTTVTIAEYFEIKDKSRVEVEVSELFSFDNNDKAVIIIDLSAVIVPTTATIVPTTTVRPTTTIASTTTTKPTTVTPATTVKPTTTVASTTTAKIYRLGETWVVEGQWALTFVSVTTTSARNQFANTSPAQVIIITYSYENLGYTGIAQDLYISSVSMKVFDQQSESSALYATSGLKSPAVLPIGTKCTNAQVSYGLTNISSEITLFFEMFGENYDIHRATFKLSVD